MKCESQQPENIKTEEILGRKQQKNSTNWEVRSHVCR